MQCSGPVVPATGGTRGAPWRASRTLLQPCWAIACRWTGRAGSVTMDTAGGAGSAAADSGQIDKVRMGKLIFGSVPFDAELIILDKDGTLIDFDFMWGRMAEAWVQRLLAAPGSAGLAAEIYRALGYDAERRRTLPGGPLEVATNPQLKTIVAAALYRHGLSWIDAEVRSQQAFQAAVELPLDSLIRPIGNLPGLLERLRIAGARLAIVTTDDRAPTEEALRILGVAQYIDCLVCGDGELPRKPAPDGVLAACRCLGVPPAHTAVIGDTVADMLMARQAGAGLVVGVLSGVGSPAQLAAYADLILNSVGDIVAAI